MGFFLNRRLSTLKVKLSFLYYKSCCKNIGVSATRKLCLQLSKYEHGEDKEEACLEGKESTETSRNMPVSQLRILVFRA